MCSSQQLIPAEIKWDPNATPPQYTDNSDQMIEKGTHLRVKLIGTRSDVGSMFAIGSIREDFLGFDYPGELDHCDIDTLPGHYKHAFLPELWSKSGQNSRST